MRVQEISESLQNWYQKHQRMLPWRLSRDPYKIWISEIMAQQTQIETMRSYYDRFIRKFPTIHDLAIADEEEILKSWEGLGYYTRARNIHRSAKILDHQYGGEFPKTEMQIQQLPGIGDYTTGAIMSIAFEKPVPAVDGNVLRVFARLEAVHENILSGVVKNQAKSYVHQLMKGAQPSILTQSLMELGALICRPKKAKCSNCPVSRHCKAFQNEQVSLLPNKVRSKSRREEEKLVLLVISPFERILVRQRKERLLHHLWEYYLMDAVEEMTAVEHLHDLGMVLNQIHAIVDHKHIFTHIIWKMRGYACYLDHEPKIDGYQWVPIQRMIDLPKPTAIKPYSEWLIKTYGQGPIQNL